MKISQIIQIAVTIILAVIMALFTFLSNTNAGILAEIKTELKDHALSIIATKTSEAVTKLDIEYIKKSQTAQEDMIRQMYNYMFGISKKKAE